MEYIYIYIYIMWSFHNSHIYIYIHIYTYICLVYFYIFIHIYVWCILCCQTWSFHNSCLPPQEFMLTNQPCSDWRGCAHRRRKAYLTEHDHLYNRDQWEFEWLISKSRPMYMYQSMCIFTYMYVYIHACINVYTYEYS